MTAKPRWLVSPLQFDPDDPSVPTVGLPERTRRDKVVLSGNQQVGLWLTMLAVLALVALVALVFWF